MFFLPPSEVTPHFHLKTSVTKMTNCRSAPPLFLGRLPLPLSGSLSLQIKSSLLLFFYLSCVTVDRRIFKFYAYNISGDILQRSARALIRTKGAPPTIHRLWGWLHPGPGHGQHGGRPLVSGGAGAGGRGLGRGGGGSLLPTPPRRLAWRRKAQNLPYLPLIHCE